MLDVGKGVDLFGKIKMIDETDDGMNDARFLPYAAGDCTGGPCRVRVNDYSPGNTTSATSTATRR